MSNSSTSHELTEVVVTSIRQAEVLSRVPISVAVFTEKQTDTQGVKEFNDIVASGKNSEFAIGAAGAAPAG
jgi:hypothetical protein